MQQGFFAIEQTCNKCNGQGQVIKNPCTTCHGSGRCSKHKNLIVNIPKTSKTNYLARTNISNKK